MDIFRKQTDILRGKPSSVVSVISSATYEHIINAIHSQDITHDTLKTIVSMCKSNPNNVVCVVYKSFEDSVLFIFGHKPFCIPVDGSKLQHIMMQQSKPNHIYIFTYVKE